MTPRPDFAGLRKASLFLALAVLASACTYRGYIDQPVTIKLTWYSYLAGEDIRRACVPKGLTRYRLVYNGRYEAQLRSYEVTSLDAGGARQVSRVLGQMRALAVLHDPSDLQGPWRWTESDEPLSPQELADFQASLVDSGFERPLTETMELLSTEFFWVASGCEDGRFTFNAWRFGSERYADLAFPAVLLAHDTTGIAVNPPRPLTPAERLRGFSSGNRLSREEQDYVFRVKVGPDGLVGMGPRL